MDRRLAVVMALWACRGSQDSTPGPSVPARSGSTHVAPGPATRSLSCDERVVRIERGLAALARSRPGFLPLVRGIDAPVSDRGRPIDRRGVVVAIAKDGAVASQAMKLPTTRDMRDFFSNVHGSAVRAAIQAGGSSADGKLPLYLWADAGAPAAAVVELVAASDPMGGKPRVTIARERTPALDTDAQRARQQAIEQARAAGILGDAPPPWFDVRLLVRTPDEVPAAPELANPSEVSSKLPGSEPDATIYLAQQLRGAVGSCAELITTLATAHLEGTPAATTDMLATKVPAALRSCGCRVSDPDVLEWGMGTWFGAWAPTLRWLPMPALREGDATTVGDLLL